MQVVLEMEKELAFIYFSVAAITGPVLGVILGGYVFSRIGGYQDPRALPLVLVIALAGCIAGIPSALVTNYNLAMALFWF